VEQGLAVGNQEVANRYLDQARRIHRIYQEEQGYYTPGATRRRMALDDFDDMLANALGNYILHTGGTDPLVKMRVWRNAPEGLKRRVYDRIREPLHAQMQRVGVDVDAAFPPPEGMEAYRQRSALAGQGERDGLLRTQPERR